MLEDITSASKFLHQFNNGNTRQSYCIVMLCQYIGVEWNDPSSNIDVLSSADFEIYHIVEYARHNNKE